MAIVSKIKSSTWVKINCILTILVSILLLVNYFKREEKPAAKEAQPHEINACCTFPCQNGGICVPFDKSYFCDCTDTGCFGKNCDKVSPLQWLNKLIKFNPTETCTSLMNRIPFLWKILNSFVMFQTIFTKNLYMATVTWGNGDFRWTTAFDLISVESLRNSSFSARSLPPVPKTCPTPMGVRGPKQLPSADVLYTRLLKRKRFIPCPKGTNMLFASYIQHFTSQFDNYEAQQDRTHEWGNNVLDMSHIYGKDEKTRHSLRSFKKGKLKSRIYKGEEYPPFLDDCSGVTMIYPQTHQNLFVEGMMLHGAVEPRWALGNPGLSMTPMLFVISTIWMREHNRVCNILAAEYPHWTDEHLYQTARLIVTGEVIKITLTEYMRHFMQLHMQILHKPELTSHLPLQFTATVPKEFTVLPHWQALMAEQLIINSELYNVSQLTFTNNMVVFENGFDQVVQAMTMQPAGKMTYGNIGETFQCCIKYAIEESRALRMQSYNNYRRRFGLKPAENFEDLTGDLSVAAILKELYFDVEAVDLIIGLLVEHEGTGVAPPSMATMSGAWLIRGLISHPVNSPNWWKPSTFGGEVGMNVVKSASLKKLICLNMKNKCHNIQVGFSVPNFDVKNHTAPDKTV